MTCLEENKSILSLNKTHKPEPCNLNGLFELLRQFKTECPANGWETSESEECIKADGEYHALFCTRLSVNI